MCVCVCVCVRAWVCVCVRILIYMSVWVCVCVCVCVKTEFLYFLIYYSFILPYLTFSWSFISSDFFSSRLFSFQTHGSLEVPILILVFRIPLVAFAAIFCPPPFCVCRYFTSARELHISWLKSLCEWVRGNKQKRKEIYEKKLLIVKSLCWHISTRIIQTPVLYFVFPQQIIRRRINYINVYRYFLNVGDMQLYFIRLKLQKYLKGRKAEGSFVYLLSFYYQVSHHLYKIWHLQISTIKANIDFIYI